MTENQINSLKVSCDNLVFKACLHAPSPWALIPRHLSWLSLSCLSKCPNNVPPPSTASHLSAQIMFNLLSLSFLLHSFAPGQLQIPSQFHLGISPELLHPGKTHPANREGWVQLLFPCSTRQSQQPLMWHFVLSSLLSASHCNWTSNS